MKDLQKELAEFIKSNVEILRKDSVDEDDDYENDDRKDVWFIDYTCPYTDYCREIVEPGNINKSYPNGAVGIRVDDDFWAIAAIPYKFKELTCEEICIVLFPNTKNPVYLADSGSIEQIQETIKHYEDTLNHVKVEYPGDHIEWSYYQDMLGYSRNKLYNRINGLDKD